MLWLIAHAVFHLWEVAVGISSPSVFPRDFPAVTLPAIIAAVLTLSAINQSRAPREPHPLGIRQEIRDPYDIGVCCRNAARRRTHLTETPPQEAVGPPLATRVILIALANFGGPRGGGGHAGRHIGPPSSILSGFVAVE